MRPPARGTDRPLREDLDGARRGRALSAGWERPPERPSLGTAETHVWAFEAVGRESARSGVRTVLASYTGLAADALVIERPLSGKPELRSTGDCPGLRFNTSASGTIALLALRRDHEVGVDVEAVRDIAGDIARRAMTPAERVTFDALPEARRPMHFCALWVAKEAVAKSLGRGLAQAFDAFDALEPVRVPFGGGVDSVWLEPLPALRDGYAAAVASAAPLGTIRLWTLLQ